MSAYVYACARVASLLSREVSFSLEDGACVLGSCTLTWLVPLQLAVGLSVPLLSG